MSTRAVGWALEQRVGLDPTSKLVLLALAEGANRVDDVVWLSRSSLADIALRSSARTVDRCIVDLQQYGYVEPAELDELEPDRQAQYLGIPQHRRPRLWRVLTGAEIAPGGVQHAAPGGVQLPGATRGAIAIAHKPINNQQIEPAAESSRRAPMTPDELAAQLPNVRQLRSALRPVDRFDEHDDATDDEGEAS